MYVVKYKCHLTYMHIITQTMTSYLSLHLSLGCIYPGLNQKGKELREINKCLPFKEDQIT